MIDNTHECLSCEYLPPTMKFNFLALATGLLGPSLTLTVTHSHMRASSFLDELQSLEHLVTKSFYYCSVSKNSVSL